MMVFLTLSVGVCCTPFWRRFMLVCMATFYFKSGEFIPPFLFFAGAILSEITLIQIAHAKANPPALDPTEPLRGWRRFVNEYWTIVLFFISYFFGTQPPSNPERSTYSQVIFNFSKNYITTNGGTCPVDLVNSRPTRQSRGCFRWHRSYSFNYVLPCPETFLLKPHLRLLRQHFIPPLPPPWNIHSHSSRLGSVQIPPFPPMARSPRPISRNQRV